YTGRHHRTVVPIRPIPPGDLRDEARPRFRSQNMLLTLALASLVGAVPADTITGTWQIQGDVSGYPVNSVCDVVVAETALTGHCASRDGSSYEITGSVKDESVTCQHAGDCDGQPLTVWYTGTIHSPTELRGTIDVQPCEVRG